MVLPDEDPAEYETLFNNYYREFAPFGPDERARVDMLIYHDWSRRRVQRFQAQLEPCAGHPTAAHYLEYAVQRLALIDRSYARTLKELCALQRKRTKTA